MYMLLSGKHPLYEEEDTFSSYSKKLYSPKHSFPDTFSEYFL